MRGQSSRWPALELRGKRIFLRPPQSTDASEFMRLMKLSARAFRGLIHPVKKGRQRFDDYLKRCAREDFLGFLICQTSDGRILGNINLFNITRPGTQSACVGYPVGAPYTRQGYATEAVGLILRFAFAKLKLHRVEANIQPNNIPSLALVKRAGFSKEGFSPRYLKIGGRWRDHERWALVAEHWRRRKGK